ncbi:MAG: hypothetical protein GY940_11445, partial [bacterium]|nr:hypothetical protein [bacterium]
ITLGTVKNVSGGLESTGQHFSLSPTVTYFVIDNLALVLSPGFSVSWGSESRFEGVLLHESPTTTSIGIGVGARYFVKRFYGGAELFYSRVGNRELKSRSASITFRLGHLSPIAKNIYIDLGLNYNTGLGDIHFSDRPDIPNDYSRFSAGAGVSWFFK